MTISNDKQTETNGGGRDGSGRFVKGGKGGPGRPAGRLAVESWRQAFAEAVTAADVKAVAKQLVESAKTGEKWAIEQLLDRCVGGLAEVDQARQLEELETLLMEKLKS